jgi:hypothetical protein
MLYVISISKHDLEKNNDVYLLVATKKDLRGLAYQILI